MAFIFQKKKSGQSWIFTGCSDPLSLSQSIGRGRTSRSGSHAVRESRSQWQKESNFGLILLSILSRKLYYKGICHFLAAETPTFGGYNFKTGWMRTIQGHKKEAPIAFWRMTRLLYWKKVTKRLQAGRPSKKRFLFGHLFLNITNVFCAKKWVGHACICPRMVTG